MNDKTTRQKGKNKTIVKWLMGGTTLLALVHGLSMVTVDRTLEYKFVTYKTKDLPPELDGYRLAFISDTHYSLRGYNMIPVKDKLNEIGVDLVLLGGDFSDYQNALEPTMETLAQIETTDGIYGVEGNHDDYLTLFTAMEKFGIVPLSNSGMLVRAKLFVGGVEDAVNRNPSIEKAVKEASPDDFVILLTHNPDVTMMQDTTKADLILAGHTHGGHANFLGIWAPALAIKGITDYGQRFRSGWAKSKDDIPVYVSNGAGNYMNIPRVFAQPEVIIMTLKKQDN